MILEKIKTHATIMVGDTNVYDNLKLEILNNNLSCLHFDYDAEDKNAKTLKLEDLEKIKLFLQNKSSDIRYVITNRNMRLTQLQNAMLKLLEEASVNTRIIFVVESVNYFLPTIISRVQILNNDDLNLDLDNNKKYKNIFSEYKKKLILGKDFSGLEKLIKLEDLNSRGLLSEKQLGEYLGLV